MDDFVIVAERIYNLTIRTMDCLKLFDDNVLVDLSCNFLGMDVLEATTKLLTKLKYFKIFGRHSRGFFYELEKFERMVKAISKMPKLESSSLYYFDIPAGWEKVVYNQQFGKSYRTFQIIIDENYNRITKNESDFNILNEKSGFKACIDIINEIP
uniref:Uncharacterized protein n=1 Tax=Panagrolaimus sp. JU765 TaxID=591449 RepID=A0AC34Q3R7_9BILA